MEQNKKGFTLIELLVVIAIFGIIAIGLSRIDLSAQIDRQNIRMFSNEIHTTIESTRNSSLLGQSFLSGTTLETPDKWKITINNGYGTGTIIRSYSMDGNDYETGGIINFIENTSINEFRCFNIEGEEQSNNPTDEISIIFQGKNISIVGCDSDYSSIIEIEPIIKENPNFRRVIRINTLSGLISQDEPN